jgi:hypothetical protein
MNRKRLYLPTLLLSLVVLLAACSGKNLQVVTDIPMHPQATKLGIEYYKHHAYVDPGWTIINGVIEGGPYAGYRLIGAETLGFGEVTPNPSVENFYDSALKGWTKQSNSYQNQVTGLMQTVFTWEKEKQVVIATTYSDGEQNILVISLCQK